MFNTSEQAMLLGRRYWELEGFLSRRPVCGAHTAALDDVSVLCSEFCCRSVQNCAVCRKSIPRSGTGPEEPGCFFLVSFLFVSSQAD